MDAAIFLWINGWAGRFAPLDTLGQVLGSDFFVPSILTLFLIALWFDSEGAGSEGRRLALRIVVALLLANTLVATLNLAYPRPRPFSTLPVHILTYRPSDPSFPSNAAAVAAVFPAVLWRRRPRLAGSAGLLGLAISLSRIFVGVHYPLDILAGWMVGGIAAAVVWRLNPRLKPLLNRTASMAERLGLV